MAGRAEAVAWPKRRPQTVWKINVGIGHSAVTVVGNRAYTMGNADDTDTVFSIDVATGKVVWTRCGPVRGDGKSEYQGLRRTLFDAHCTRSFRATSSP